MNPSNGTVGNFNVPQPAGMPTPGPGQGLPQPQTRPTPAGQPPSGSPAAPTADNDALLDQAIAHAENIINQTRSDPQQQSIALEKLKADYVRSKFGKSIKMVDN